MHILTKLFFLKLFDSLGGQSPRVGSLGATSKKVGSLEGYNEIFAFYLFIYYY
jgi:hypothetical protein